MIFASPVPLQLCLDGIVEDLTQEDLTQQDLTQQD
jgi:hypothetical protein